MSKRLVKVAKELNVGVGTIVEYLLESGFNIKNRPTAKVTPEMYEELLKEFEGSISIKKEADKIDIGSARSRKSREQEKAKDTEKATTKVEAKSDEPKEKDTEKAVDLKPEKTESQKTPKSTDEKKEQKQEKPVEKKIETKEKETEKEKEDSQEEKKKTSGLKVVGKIDLDKKKPSKEEKKKEEKSTTDLKETKQEEEDKQQKQLKEQKVEKKKEEKPKKVEPEKVQEDKADTKKEEKVEAKKEEEKGETIRRASKPKLKGLKIMGKIDKDKLNARLKGTKKSKSSSKEEKEKKRRRRPRKKIRARKPRTKTGRTQQEVTQKEIEEKIKATQARISGASRKNKRKERRRKKKEEQREKQIQSEMSQELESKVLQVTEFVSVSELASLMEVQPIDVITKCMNLGVIVSINQRLDAEIIEIVASEYDYEVEFISAEEQTDEDDWIDDPEDLEPRAPIITVMGHVDHGKTSLLDYIRKASVAAGEAGGITQHIGAYEVYVGNEDEDEYKKITFLDTPGHEAFTAMRARGAKITDVAVIIIAADDSIMPQTREAISHAEAAGVPMVFAINKIDKPGAQPEKIINELAQMNYLVEEWGGKYQSQRISAKTGEGIEELLEKITLEADLLELEANPERPAIGVVLEASLDRGRGYVAKLLVQEGTLRIGDPVVAGEHSGKVKAMFNEVGKRVDEVGPSQPTLMLGLSGAPQAGERFKVMESEQAARSLANSREQIIREQTNRATKRISLDEIGRRLALGNFKELNLIVKGDVDGTVEALSDSLIKQSVESIQVNVIHKAVGQIIESDVLLASASDAIIIGFQVRPSLGARKLADKEGIQIKTYSVIYEAIEEIRAAMEGMLEPKEEEKITGEVEVREVFKISKVGTVAGCYVQDGHISRNSHIRIIREGIVIYPKKEGQVGEISSLKRFKDDVKMVKTGMECGISIDGYNDLKVGDVIEAYEIIEIEQTL